jgi:hypothetical protein
MAIKADEDTPADGQTDADIDTREQWIDAHSVMCALCGALTDEREAINLYEQDTGIEGEAHADCWDEHDE